MAAAVERDLASVQDDAPMVDVVDVSGHPSGSPDGRAAAAAWLADPTGRTKDGHGGRAA